VEWNTGYDEEWPRLRSITGLREEVADDDGGWRLVSLSTALVLGLATWAAVRFAAAEIGEAHRRRLVMPRDDEHRELGARR